MPNAVDERIVAAKFDASDFEKGVDKTIKKLDELKKSLDFKEATKGVKELAEKTEVSTDSMSKSLEKLTDRFTTFTGMIKQKILGGLADEVAGVFLRMEQSVKSFIKAISTDQISAGMAKYEQILTSVRVMMSAGKSENEAYEYIRILRDYSDQTSYSLSQMTDSLSKMVAAGVDLDTATKSVEGIANACASAGVNAMDAQRAFYNLSQAYSKGTLNYNDYRSLELLNMTTKKMKENMLEAAVEAKTLKKVSDGVYQTINKEDKKVKAGKKVTADNITDMLRYDFMNKNAMNILFGKKYFFDEKEFEKYKKPYLDDNGDISKSDRKKAIEAAKKDYGELAVEAYLAAREARNFTDVLNTIKDVVSTGWSTTFEQFFGKLEEAKDFFTELAEGPLADFIYKIGEYRNAVLGYWNSVTAAGDGAGGKMFRDTILNISDALGILFKTFLQVLPGFNEIKDDENQPQLKNLGIQLKRVTAHVRDFSMKVREAAVKFNEFMTSPAFDEKNGPTRIELIRQAFANLINIFGILGKSINFVFDTFGTAFKVLSPILDGFLQAFVEITNPIEKLNKESTVFTDLQNSVNNIATILTPVAKVLGRIVGFASKIAGFIIQMSLDTVTMNIQFFSDALGFLLELFGAESSQLKNGAGVLNGIAKSFEEIKTACGEGLSTVKTFFNTLIDDLKKLFGLTEQTGDQAEEGGVFAGLTNFFNTNEFVQKAKEWVNKAIIDVGNFIQSIPSKIREFGANIYTTIRNLFFKDEKVTKDGKEETQTVLTPLGEWLSNVIKDIKEFVISIPHRIIEGVGKVGNWIDTIFNSLFGEKPVEKADKTNSADQAKEETLSQFDQFVQETVASIKAWFEDLPNKIRTGLANIGNFFTRLFGTISEFLFGKKVTKTVKLINPLTGKTEFRKITTTYKTGFSKWLDGVIKDVKKFITNIPEYIKAGIQGAGDIVTTIINALFGKTDNNKTTGNELQDKLEEPFLKIDLSNILTKLKEIGETLLNQIARIFTGTDDLEYNEQWFAEKIAEGIKWIREKASLALNYVLDFLVNLPTRIANLFKGEGKDASNQEKGPIGQAILDFGKSIGEFIQSLPAKILEFVNNAIDLIGDIWDKFYNGIINGSKEQNEKVSKYAEDELGYPKSFSHRTHKSGWEKFVENLGKTISHAFEELPIWVANGIELAVKALGDLIQNLGNWISGIGENVDAKKEASEALSTVASDVGDGAKNGLDSGEPKLITAIKKIGERIGNLFTQIIPTFISDAWNTIFGVGSQVWTGLSAIFSGKELTAEDGDIANAVKNLGDQVKDFIVKDLPGKISAAWDEIKAKGAAVFEGIKSVFTGEVPKNEVSKAVAGFCNKVKKFIITDVPNAINEAFRFISNLFSSPQKAAIPPMDIFGQTLANSLNKDSKEFDVDKATKEFQRPMARTLDKIQDDLKKKAGESKKEIEQPGFWGFVEGIKNGIISGFEDVGPAILNGIAKALDFLSNIGTIVIDTLTGKNSVGDQVKKIYGKTKPELVESLTKIGESLKNFFLDILPKFLGSAIGAVAGKASDWFTKVFGAMKDSAENAKDKALNQDGGGANHGFDDEKDAVENTVNVLDWVKGFFDKIKEFVGVEGEDFKVLGFMVLAVMLFNKIAEIFSAAEVAENIGYTVKWAALFVAFSALGGLLSFMSSIAREGTEDQVNRFNTMLNGITDLLDKLKWVLGFLTAGKVFDMIGDIANAKTAKNELKKEAGEKLGINLKDGILGFFTNFLRTMGIGAGLDVSAKLFSSATETTFNAIGDAFISVTSSLDAFLGQIDPIINQLTAMDGKFDTAFSAIQKISDMFSRFYTMFDSLYEQIGGKVDEGPNAVAHAITKTPSGETMYAPNKQLLDIVAFKTELQHRLDLLVEMGSFVSYIASAIEKLNGVENVQSKMDELTEVLTGEGSSFKDFLTQMLNILNSAIEASEIDPKKMKVTDYIMLKDTGMALAIQMISDALSLFATSISGFDESNIDAYKKALDILAEFAEAFSGTDVTANIWDKIFKGESSLSVIGREIKLFSINVKGFFDQIKDIPGFKSDEVEATKNKVDSIITLAKGFAEATNGINVLATDFDFLTNLGDKLPNFGESMMKLFGSLHDWLPDEITPEETGMIRDAVESVADILSLAGNLKYQSIAPYLDQLISDFDHYEESSALSASILGINKAVSTAISREETTNSFVDAGRKIAKRLFEGIQAAFNEDQSLRPEITPVLKLEPMKDQLREAFGTDLSGGVQWDKLASAVYGANGGVDEERVKATDLYAKIDSVNEKIEALAEAQASLDNLTSAFARMGVYINKNALIGEISDDMTDVIDYKIGVKIADIERGLSTGAAG